MTFSSYPEELLAELMAPIAARENAACAQHWDVNRLGSRAGKQGTVGGRVTRVAELTELLRDHGTMTLEDIAKAMDLSRTTASNYLAAIRVKGILQSVKRGGRHFYSIKQEAE